MRKSKEEAAQTRRRIVESAAAEFRRNGIAGTGLSELMGVAGLTHGGFYRHFDSKDELIKESCASAIDSMVASVESSSEARPGRAGVQAAIQHYLTAAHRDSKTECCPFAALASELARGTEGVRETATEGFLKLVELIAGGLDDLPPAAAKKEALVLLSTMIGAMTMARMVADDELSDAILRQTKKSLVLQVQGR